MAEICSIATRDRRDVNSQRKKTKKKKSIKYNFFSFPWKSSFSLEKTRIYGLHCYFTPYFTLLIYINILNPPPLPPLSKKTLIVFYERKHSLKRAETTFTLSQPLKKKKIWKLKLTSLSIFHGNPPSLIVFYGFGLRVRDELAPEF